GIAPPGAVEVAVLRQLPPGVPEPLARRRIARAHLAAQQAADTFRRVADGALEPGVEGLAEEPILDVAGRDLEDGIDARLHRALPQQVGAEGVDGPDGSGFQPLESGGEAAALFVRGA